MRKFDLKRGVDNTTIAWGIDIVKAKEVLDKLYEEEYILVLSGTTTTEYSFPHWYKAHDKAYDHAWNGEIIKYSRLVNHENHYYSVLSP